MMRFDVLGRDLLIGDSILAFDRETLPQRAVIVRWDLASDGLIVIHPDCPHRATDATTLLHRHRSKWYLIERDEPDFSSMIGRAAALRRQATEVSLGEAAISALIVADALAAHIDQLDDRLARIERSLDNFAMTSRGG